MRLLDVKLCIAAGILPAQKGFHAGGFVQFGQQDVYKRQLHTHMRDGIPDGTFQQPEHLQLFRKRLSDFFAIHNNKEERISLYLGHLTQMLTDEKFILEIHPYVLQRIAVTGYDRDNPQTYVKFGRDVDQIDFRLVKEFPGIDKAYQALCQVTPYEIADYITEQELTASREWIKSYFFETEHTIEDPIFLPYQEMYQFIPEAVSQICDRLPEYITSCLLYTSRCV